MRVTGEKILDKGKKHNLCLFSFLSERGVDCVRCGWSVMCKAVLRGKKCR